MHAGLSGLGATAWFIRRAGLARCTTIACVAGLCLAGLFPGRYPLAIVGLTVALAGIFAGHVLTGVRPLSRRGLAVTLVSVVAMGLFAGLLAGTLRVSSLLDGVLSSRIGQSVKAEIVITGAVRSNSGWQTATAVVRTISAVGDKGGEAGSGAGTGEKVLLEVPPADNPAVSGDNAGLSAGGPTAPALTQGALLAVRGVLRAPEGPSASGFDQASQLLHQGILVVLRVQAGSISFEGQRGGVGGWFDRLRRSAEEHLDLGPDRRVSEVLRGVVMGDTIGIEPAWMDAFRRSGTAHMLSVSGLHVASLAAIMIALAGFVRLSRRAGFVLATAAALLMIPFVGPSPPIVRSAAMIVVVLAGRWVGRRRDRWQGLAFAAVVVLFLNPFAVFDVGFQLSFSAFAGMLALVRPMEGLLRRVPDSLRANLAVSLAATLGTAPVSLLAFGRTSLISPLANLLVVPTLPAITGLGMASVLFGSAWSGFSIALDALASLPMSWTILVSTLCARAPVLGTGDIGRALLALALAGLTLPAALALSGRVVSPPLGMRLPLFRRSLFWLRAHRPRDRRVALSLAVVATLAGLVIGAVAYPVAAGAVRSVEFAAGGKGWPAQVEIRALDVGQGTAVLVRTPEHHALLFDAGPEGCGLAAQLQALGVRRLDLVVISHPHADHFGGLLEAIDAVDVGTFVDRTEVVSSAPKQAGSAATPARADNGHNAGEEAGGGQEALHYLELRQGLAARGCRLEQAGPGASLSMDGISVRFFAPARPLVLIQGPEPWGGGAPPSGDELNIGSLVVALSVGSVGFLLPGDAEASALDGYDLPPVEVLVVPHHGSRDGVTPALLARLRPRLAIISVGKDNPFGHPDPSTMAILAAAGDIVVRTDGCGWVSLRLNGAQMAISMERTMSTQGKMSDGTAMSTQKAGVK